MKNSKRKIKFRVKRIKMSRTIRMVAITILGIILLFSAFSTYAAYQKPTNTEESYTTLTYGQSGRYNYIVYLENNTVYNKSQLLPGEGIIFEQIVKNISASFSYEFQIDDIADIQGNYNIQAEIQTDLWTKTYTIVPSTSFNYSGKHQKYNQK